ncbi:MAG TPA: prepilin peptidase [Candidatus Paceibacterota bacterium]|nr:prepilin peptidase [Candidatus Paceibacterota bacterium]
MPLDPMVAGAISVFFLLGAIVSSFIGVLVARMHTGQSFLTGRSHCDACNATLAPLTLVPILSFVASGGRATCCGTRLSTLSPLTEILLGSLFVLSYLTVGYTLVLLGMLIALSLLLALVLYDLTHQILPPTLLYLFIAVSAVTSFIGASSYASFLQTALVAFLIALSLLAIHIFSRGRAMGFADAPFVFGLALLVGSAALPGFVFSFWIGAVVGIVLLLKRPHGSRMGVEVPFAPFLAAGFLLAYFTQWNPFVLTVTLLNH